MRQGAAQSAPTSLHEWDNCILMLIIVNRIRFSYYSSYFYSTIFKTAPESNIFPLRESQRKIHQPRTVAPRTKRKPAPSSGDIRTRRLRRTGRQHFRRDTRNKERRSIMLLYFGL